MILSPSDYANAVDQMRELNFGDVYEVDIESESERCTLRVAALDFAGSIALAAHRIEEVTKIAVRVGGDLMISATGPDVRVSVRVRMAVPNTERSAA